MPDDVPDSASAPATAPSETGLQSAPGQPGMTSGGAGGTPPQGGVLPPSASAPPAGAGMHPAGLHMVGMQGIKGLMGMLHYYTAFLDPASEESMAAKDMFKKGFKHFMPDTQAARTGQMPQMGGAPGGAGGMPGMGGGPPQGGGQIPMMPSNNRPTGPAPMRQ